ncbi:MAG: chemotaxis protein CheB [Planctomycetota bacterium]
MKQTDRESGPKKEEAVIQASETEKPGDGPFVLGIGASAGGLESLERFFNQMPSQSGMAFVVIQHLSPDYKSLMVQLLSKHTNMPVQRAEQGQKILPNQVYLIPPRMTMKIQDGRIQLSEQEPNTLHLPIDTFFESLGKDQRERAIGIVLSGTGSDGMRGIRTIKENGGMVVVQTVADAKFDGMPKSAISTGLPDYILPADEMPSALLSFVENPGLLSESRDPTELYRSQQDAMDQIISTVNRFTGVDFTFYRPATIVRRVERRMSITKCTTLQEYADLIEDSEDEALTLYKELLIGVTRFFRDEQAFEVLSHQVIPQILEQSNPIEPIRIWVAGCSTGEEAYSLAMLIIEYLEKHNIDRKVMVFATDLDREAIEYAAEGAYPESIIADLSSERLNRFFVKRDEKYYVKRQLREMIIFAPQNLIKDPPFSNMDMVCCRNLLIYLQPSMQKRVLAMMAYSLKHQGFLFLGSSETLGESVAVFRAVDSRRKIYQKVASSQRLVSETLSRSKLRSEMIENEKSRSENSISSGMDSTVLQGAMQELLLSRRSCALILDESCLIRHVFGQTQNLLQLQPGKASLDARKIMSNDLSIALSTAINRSWKTGQEVVYSRIQTHNAGQTVDLRIRPLPQVSPNNQRMFLALFETVSNPSSPDASTTASSRTGDSDDRMHDLEQELQFTKANLQSTIEELQTSNEELQATNEELVTSNEELQSTNEELQSVNEELHTVNSEYQEKIEELTQLNNDVDNLLRATEVGVLFLDINMHIRKFTPTISEVINILPQDLGRPISHITTKARDFDLAGQCAEVLKDRTPRSRELAIDGESDYLIRFVPYRTEEDRLDGLIVTCVDISEVKRTRGRYEAVLDLSEHEIALLDSDGEIVQTNAAWQSMAEELDSNGNLLAGSNFLEDALPLLAPESSQGESAEWLGQFEKILKQDRQNLQLEFDLGHGKSPYLLDATTLSGRHKGAIIRLTSKSKTV